MIAGLETACLHTSSVYTSGSHSSVVSSLSAARGTATPTAALFTGRRSALSAASFWSFLCFPLPKKGTAYIYICVYICICDFLILSIIFYAPPVTESYIFTYVVTFSTSILREQ